MEASSHTFILRFKRQAIAYIVGGSAALDPPYVMTSVDANQIAVAQRLASQPAPHP